MPWFKGNIHTHTTNSDGDSSPDHVSKWYKQNNYDFLVLTDHNHLTILDEDKKKPKEWPLLIPGEEITIREIGSKPAALHINGIGINNVIMPGAYENNIDAINDVVIKIKEQNGLSSINHPNYQWWLTSEDIKYSEDAWAFEVFNGHMSANNDGSLYSMSTEEIWDDVLSHGKLIYGVATDDSHHFNEEFSANRSNPGRGWLMVNANELNQENIIDAMKSGRFYSSSGVKFSELELSKDRINLKIEIQEPAKKSKYTIKIIHNNGLTFFEDETDQIDMPINGAIKYYRLVVISSDGTKAWAQPIFL